MLSPELRSEMESGFGCDFSRVRIYADGAAAASAQELQAHAYTAGENVVFGRGEFAPGTAAGQRLIAHELAHVVQQRSGTANLIQRKPIAGATTAADAGKQSKESKGSKTIIAIHAKPGELTAVGYVAEGVAPVDITLKANELEDEGKVEFTRDDDPSTKGFIEYRSEDHKPFSWSLPSGYVTGPKVIVTVTPGEFSLEGYANQRFDAVPERIKARLYSKRGKQLETPQEKLGFADFAERLQKRGITDEELILFQTRAKTADSWRHIDWATEWMEAADTVIGARAELEAKAITNLGNFSMNAAQLPELSEAAVELFRKRGSFVGMDVLADAALQESGISLAELKILLDGMMESFDSQMRLETAVALDRLEGGLLLMRERYVDAAGGDDAITKIRAAAGRQPTLEKKAARQRAAETRDKAEVRAMLDDAGSALLDPLHLGTSQSAKDLAEAEGNYSKANNEYLKQLDSISQMPISSWRGFNTEQFFYGGGAYSPKSWLRSYITQMLNDVGRARKKIGEDRRTLYKADVMVSHTKTVMGIESGSSIDKLVDDRVEDYKSAPFWERLLDILSLALMFVPGGAFITAARFAIGIAQTVNTIESETTAEILARPNLKTEGGSISSVGLSIVGNVTDVADLASIGKGLGTLGKGAEVAGDVVSHSADDVVRAADNAGEAAAKAEIPKAHNTTQPDLPSASAAPEKPLVTDAPSASTKAEGPDSLPAETPPKAPDVDSPKKAPDATPASPAYEDPIGELNSELEKVPLNESSMIEVGADTHKIPVADGPQVGQKMGKRTADTVDRAPKRVFTNQERQALARTEAEMAEKKVDDAMQELGRTDPELYDVINNSTVRTQSNQTMAQLYAQNPVGMRQYYDEYADYVARKAAKNEIPARFDTYTKYRLRGERGAAGELTDAFARGPDEIMVKAPKTNSNLPGTDSVTYVPSTKRVKLRDNKSLTTGGIVSEVSALERNLIKNIGDDIEDIEKYIRNSDVPAEIRNDVLPRMKAAREELLAYTAKNPVTKANATRADVRDAFDSILRNHGIDRVVTRTGSGAGVGMGKGLGDDAGFLLE
jgi:uncharacterized protein DUF4157